MKLILRTLLSLKEYWHGGGRWFEGEFYCKSIDVRVDETKFIIPFEKIKKIDFFWKEVESDSMLIYLQNDKKIKIREIGLFWEYFRHFEVVGERYNPDLEIRAQFKEPDYSIKSIELSKKIK